MDETTQAAAPPKTASALPDAATSGALSSSAIGADAVKTELAVDAGKNEAAVDAASVKTETLADTNDGDAADAPSAPTTDGAAPGDSAPETLSKRAARREKRRVYFDGKREKKKLQKKLAKEERPPQPEKELDMSDEAVLRRRERTIAKRETYLMAAEEGIKVVIDCGFEEEMDSREKKSLSQQIMCVWFRVSSTRRSATLTGWLVL